MPASKFLFLDAHNGAKRPRPSCQNCSEPLILQQVGQRGVMLQIRMKQIGALSQRLQFTIHGGLEPAEAHLVAMLKTEGIGHQLHAVLPEDDGNLINDPGLRILPLNDQKSFIAPRRGSLHFLLALREGMREQKKQPSKEINRTICASLARNRNGRFASPGSRR